MLFNRLSPVAKRLVRRSSPFTRPSRWNAAILRLEALDERVVPSFAEPTIYPVGPGAYSLAAADFTGDGIIDLADEIRDGTSACVLAGNGDGSFQPARTRRRPRGIAPGGRLRRRRQGGPDRHGEQQPERADQQRGRDLPAGPARHATAPDAARLPPSGAPAPIGRVRRRRGPQRRRPPRSGRHRYHGPHDRERPGPYGGSTTKRRDSTYANVLIGTGLGTFDHAAPTSWRSARIHRRTSWPDVGDFNGDGNLDLLTSDFFDVVALGNDYSACRRGWATATEPSSRRESTGGNCGDGHFVQHAVADFNQDGRTRRADRR